MSRLNINNGVTTVPFNVGAIVKLNSGKVGMVVSEVKAFDDGSRYHDVELSPGDRVRCLLSSLVSVS